MDSMKSVLVTGGAGFIGSHLCERLLSDGHKVVCLDNFNNYYDPATKKRHLNQCYDHSGFTLIEGDIRDEAVLSKAWQHHAVTHVAHLAARAGVRASLQEPTLYIDVNIRGTQMLLDKVLHHGTEHFVFASSSSVYGERSLAPFNEDDPVDKPVSPYAATKRAAELICYNYHHLYSIPITGLRFFTVYGPRQRPDMAIHKFTRAISLGEPITLYGDGTSKRDYTYISDIVNGIVAALETPMGYQIYNLGGGQVTELNQLIQSLEQHLEKAADIRYLPEQAGDVPITCSDTSKARASLGYAPQVKIEQGLQEFVTWWKQSQSSIFQASR